MNSIILVKSNFLSSDSKSIWWCRDSRGYETKSWEQSGHGFCNSVRLLSGPTWRQHRAMWFRLVASDWPRLAEPLQGGKGQAIHVWTTRKVGTLRGGPKCAWGQHTAALWVQRNAEQRWPSNDSSTWGSQWTCFTSSLVSNHGSNGDH